MLKDQLQVRFDPREGRGPEQPTAIDVIVDRILDERDPSVSNSCRCRHRRNGPLICRSTNRCRGVHSSIRVLHHTGIPCNERR